MKNLTCFTATLNANTPNEHPVLSHGITLPVRRTEFGPRSWLGCPHVVRAEVGPQNEGLRCDFLDITPDLAKSAQPTSKLDGKLTFKNCSLTAVPSGRPQLGTATGESAGEYLVLLRISQMEGPTEPKHEIELDVSHTLVATGHVIDYGRVAFTRNPSRFVKSRFHERLLRLQEGDSYRIEVLESEVRVLGLAVNYGRRVTYEISVVEGSLRFLRVEAKPLTVERFDGSAFAKDISGGLLCLLFGIMCGVLAMPHDKHAIGALIGIASGAVLYGLISVSRYLFARYAGPRYTKPLS